MPGFVRVCYRRELAHRLALPVRHRLRGDIDLRARLVGLESPDPGVVPTHLDNAHPLRRGAGDVAVGGECPLDVAPGGDEAVIAEDGPRSDDAHRPDEAAAPDRGRVAKNPRLVAGQRPLDRVVRVDVRSRAHIDVIADLQRRLGAIQDGVGTYPAALADSDI